MKPINHHLPARFRANRNQVRSGAAAAVIAIALANTAWSADVTLNAGTGGAGDTVGTSSFATSLNWSDSLAPAAGNAYIVPAGRSLRTTLDAGVDLPFAGDSLAITGSLVYKSGSVATNINTVTINNLTLDGGTVNNATNVGASFILAGNGITVLGTGTSTLFANNASITVNAPIGGTTGTLVLSTNNTLGRQVILAGANTYTGTISVTGASGAVLASTGSLAFKIGATGVNNTITGTVAFTFDGTFNIDLTTAGDTVGNNWTLVNPSLSETYGTTFNIPGFTEVENVWTSTSGKYQFSETTGVLSRIASDTDGDGLPDAWEVQYFGVGNLGETPGGDFDGDLATNLLEYQNSTNPNNPARWPDTDADGLNDGWEMVYFAGSLAQTAADDPDGDFNSNAIEFAAGSLPNNAYSYIDTENGGLGDGLNDGWEIHYFGSITAAVADVDSDGDLFTNYEEFAAGSDPKVQISSPDTDFDGLPDGWEVKLFRVGNESLNAAIAHQEAAGDPDSDHISNLLEFKAGTNPVDAGSGDPTLGYWRFEEMLAGEVPAGGNGAFAFPLSITDSSPYGNPMMAWADYSRPNYEAVVPAPVVPATGAANTASLYFLRNGNDPRYFIESVFTTGANLLPAGQGFLRTYTLPEFTVELSFNTPLTGVWQVPICKAGNPVAGQPPFSLKVDTTNKLRAGMVDGSGVAREIISTTTVAAGSWYSAAVTATATELKLWLKGPADTSYRLEGQLAISGAWFVPAAGPLDTIWNIGGGQWNGLATDAFQGEIDEVRLSTVALAPEKFLFYTAAGTGGYADWAATRITDASRRLETDDADADGTSNLTEFRLGLYPGNGASRFAAAQAGDGTMTWPSATGVTFSIQRSDTMAAGSWMNIATVPGTAGTATFKDLTPPAGKAFYRILLEP